MRAQTILVVAAHPDDEVLGCGGTIVRHARAGDDVHLAILAEGATSRDEVRNESHRSAELNALREAAELAGSRLGAKSVHFCGLPDNRIDSVDLLEVVKIVEDLVRRLQPSIVYTHHAGDVNIDHRIIHQAVFTACRPLPDHPVSRILAFEVASSTEWTPGGSLPPFIPNWHVDISDTLSDKIEALRCYEQEMRPWPHPRSYQAVEYQARWRGATVGLAAAEAFMLVREVRRG